MTRPRIISSTPPPTRLFPPLPDDIREMLVSERPSSQSEQVKPRRPELDPSPSPASSRDVLISEPVGAVPGRSERRIAGRWLVLLLIIFVAIVAWALYATLALAGVPIAGL